MNAIKKISFIGMLLVSLVGSSFASVMPNVVSAATASTVTRTISNLTPTTGSSLTISLAVNVQTPDTYYAIDEIVPAGWTISNPGTGDTTQAGHLKWVVITGAASTTYEYIVTVPATATGANTFSGTAGFGSSASANTVIPVAGDANVTVSSPALTAIAITPVNPSIAIGSTTQFTAIGLDQNGVALATQPTLVWSSSNSSIAGIDSATGLATGTAIGTITIGATNGTIEGTTTLTVNPAVIAPVLTSVTVTPATSTIVAGSSTQLTSNPLDQNLIPFVGATTAWSSSDTAVATVDINGLVTGISTGTSTVTATATMGTTTVTGTSLITVTPSTVNPVLTSITISPVNPSIAIGSTTQFTATGLDQNGVALVTQPLFDWTSSNMNTGTIGLDNGMFTAVAAGTSTITVTSEGTTVLSTTTTATVSAPLVLTTINVAPVNPSINVGSTTQFTAIGLDQNGAALATQPVFTWTSSNPSVASVGSTTGIATGASVGTTTITATSGTVTGTTVLTVNAPVFTPVLTSITIAPVNPTLAVGSSTQFTAVGLDQNGVALVTQPLFDWTSSSSTVGTIGLESGMFSALTAGTTTIMVSTEEGTVPVVSATTTVTVDAPVVNPVLTSIMIAPLNPTLAIGNSTHFTATGLDQNGVALAVQPLFDWTSSNTTTGTIGLDNGMFTAVANGVSTITATAEGITPVVSASTTVTVSSTPVSTSTLMVTKITPVQVSGTSDNTYANGWKWVFDVTVPNNETQLGMKFTDWVSGSNTIPAAGNIRYFSAQSNNANSEATAVSIDTANAYPTANIILNSDLDVASADRQIQITVEVKIPVGTAVGAYSTTYGIQSTAPTSTQTLNITNISNPANINVPFDTKYAAITFPATIAVTLNDSSTTTLPVVWSTISSPVYNDEATGTYAFPGTLTLPASTTNTSNLVPMVNVVVASSSQPLNISSVTNPADISVAFGTASSSITFPTTVGVTLGDNSTTTIAVVWNATSTPAYNANATGTYAFPGTLTLPSTITNTGNKIANVNVIVEPASTQPLNISSIATSTDINVAYDTEFPAITFPTSVTVTLSDNSTTTLPVIWSPTSSPVYNDEATGTYAFPGTLTLPASTTNTNNLQPMVNVIVAEPTVTDLRGTYNLDFTDASSAVFSHTMTIATEDFTTGNFTGSGSYIADPSIIWAMTGNIVGNNVTFHIEYNGTVTPYSLDGIGTVTGNVITGTATGSGTFTFTATKQ